MNQTKSIHIYYIDSKVKKITKTDLTIYTVATKSNFIKIETCDPLWGFLRSPMMQHISKGEQVRDMTLIRLTIYRNYSAFYSDSSLKQQTKGRQVAPLNHNDACLAEKQQTPILKYVV